MNTVIRRTRIHLAPSTVPGFPDIPYRVSIVSEPALFARVQRALRRDGQMLRRCSDRSRWFPDLGRYYAHDDRRNLTQADIDLERCARELGILRADEALAEQP